MLEIVESPNPKLLEKSVKCDLNDPTLKELSEGMIEMMYKYCGVGLAGPQVGVLKHIIVIDCDYDPEDIENTKNPIVLINPVFLDKSGELEESTEGCLSCPGISTTVMRYPHVKVEYYDLEGNKNIIEGTELLAHCLQHEIDHLKGKTILQTCKPELRLQLLKDYQMAKEQGAIPGQILNNNEA